MMKQCAKCGKIIPIGEKYCEECSQKVRKEKATASNIYSGKRNKKHTNFYKTNDWKVLRNRKLSAANYLCEDCLKKGKKTLAMDVHHIVPIADDFSKRLDYNNLVCLCVSCHNLRHKRF
ncbi:MAG: HNH endonuclease signature motif containing protein [Clostridia bacterium]